jgi:hypothetical protein
MSQFFTGITGSNLPSNIPTSVTTDEIDSLTPAIGLPLGTVVPQTNIIRMGGDNGIATYEIANQPGAMTVGFIRGGPVTTVDNSSTLIISNQPTPTNSTTTVQILVSGFGSDSTSYGAYATVVIGNVAGVASVVGSVDFIVNASPLILPLNPANGNIANSTLSITTAGPNFSVNVVGPPIGTITITWEACLPGIVIS